MVYPGTLSATTTIQLWGRNVKVQQVSSSIPPAQIMATLQMNPVPEITNANALTVTPVDRSPCTSEEDEEPVDPSRSPSPPECTGKLSKWTNYFHGWQERFIALRNGCLSYYKTPNDQNLGCRGALNIRQAVVQVSSSLLNCLI